MAADYGWQFHTKLEMAAAQIEWLVQQLGPDRPPSWVVTDGAYAKRPFLKRVLAAGATVISRLRCDAALWSLPPVVDPGKKKGRGRPPKYGKDRIDLAGRAAQTRGWQIGLVSLYGRLAVKKYQTFLATYKPVGGVIRAVLVRQPDRWVAYFSTHPDLSVASILATVSDRSALEQVFHDVKEVHGAGQQQLRQEWANVGAWNLIGWWHALVELWAWGQRLPAQHRGRLRHMVAVCLDRRAWSCRSWAVVGFARAAGRAAIAGPCAIPSRSSRSLPVPRQMRSGRRRAPRMVRPNGYACSSGAAIGVGLERSLR